MRGLCHAVGVDMMIIMMNRGIGIPSSCPVKLQGGVKFHMRVHKVPTNAKQFYSVNCYGLAMITCLVVPRLGSLCSQSVTVQTVRLPLVGCGFFKEDEGEVGGRGRKRGGSGGHRQKK